MFRFVTRRKIIQYVVLAFSAFATCLQAQSNQPLGTDWPAWRGPRADGTWAAPPLKREWPKKLKQRWRAEVDPGYSGISIVGNRVFTMDRTADKTHERVICLSLSDGNLVWEHKYNAPYGKLDYGKGPRSTPTYSNGRLYTLGAVGDLRCLDARSGRVIWKRQLVEADGAQMPTWGFAASPLVVNGLVIVQAGAKDGSYIGFDQNSGQPKWKAGNDPAGYGTLRYFRRGQTSLFVGWTPEHIVGFSQSGSTLWRIPYKVTYGVSIADPIIHDGLVVVCGYWDGSRGIAIDKKGIGQLKWTQKKNLRGLMSQPLCRQGHAYLIDRSHGLVCFRVATGEVVWKDEHRLTPRGRYPQASLVWASGPGNGDLAVALNSDGQLVLFDAKPSGYREWARAPGGSGTWAHPAYSKNLVVALDDSQIVCVELPIRQ